MCGRGLTDATAASFARAVGGYPAATALRLSGAYRLSDEVRPGLWRLPGWQGEAGQPAQD